MMGAGRFLIGILPVRGMFGLVEKSPSDRLRHPGRCHHVVQKYAQLFKLAVDDADVSHLSPSLNLLNSEMFCCIR